MGYYQRLVERMPLEPMTPIPSLDLSEQIESLWDDINAAIQRVLRSGQFVLGPEVAAFEQAAAAYLGVKHAVGVNSGTDALIIGLRALGIGPGDEVITTPFSFFATAESISAVGAKPVFVDVDEATFNIDPELIEAAINERTKAIMPVHLYGLPAAMTKIKALAKKYGLKVIEDCAQSFGARYLGACGGCGNTCDREMNAAIHNKQTGSIGDVGAFSFYPTKNLGAFGDGGLITTNDDGIAERCRMLRSHGEKSRYHNELLGYNSRLDALQAAILRVKLPYIDIWNAQRREVAARYSAALRQLEGLRTPELHPAHIFHQYTIRIAGAQRDRVQAQLKAQGISTVVYYPLGQDQLPVYAGHYAPLPVSRQLTGEVLSLPIWASLPAPTLSFIVERLRVALQFPESIVSS
jgi:dTDP-4-amino-4,6-dideoxygalactose transaminase